MSFIFCSALQTRRSDSFVSLYLIIFCSWFQCIWETPSILTVKQPRQALLKHGWRRHIDSRTVQWERAALNKFSMKETCQTWTDGAEKRLRSSNRLPVVHLLHMFLSNVSTPLCSLKLEDPDTHDCIYSDLVTEAADLLTDRRQHNTIRWRVENISVIHHMAIV